MTEEKRNWLKDDLPHIKWGLLALAVALLVGAAIVLLSQDYFGNAQKFRDTETKRLSTARKNLASAQEDRMNMDTYTQEYARLLNRNIIGDEHRLDWIDGLEAIRNRSIVLGFKYTIEPQAPYKPPVAVDSGNFVLHQSGMTLNLGLLHAGQLVRFYEALRSIKGMFILDGCRIERMSDTQGTSTSGFAPQLTADCHGEWLTMQNRNTP